MFAGFVAWLKQQQQKLCNGEKDEDKKVLQKNDIRDMILNISCLMASEFTIQFYNIASQALESLKNNETQQQRMARSKQLYDRVVFMNGKFTSLSISYWLELVKEESKIKTAFNNMFFKLCSEFETCFKKTDAVKLFLTDQQNINEELQKIIEQFEKQEKYNIEVKKIHKDQPQVIAQDQPKIEIADLINDNMEDESEYHKSCNNQNHFENKNELEDSEDENNEGDSMVNENYDDDEEEEDSPRKKYSK